MRHFHIPAVLALTGAAAAVLASCGPEKKTQTDDRLEPPANGSRTAAPTSSGAEELALRLEDALAARPADLEEADRQARFAESASPVQQTPATHRTCDDSRSGESGETLIYKEWKGTIGSLTFIDGAGIPNSRLETWTRAKPIPCSAENWAKVGWQAGDNLEGLTQRVSVQLALSRTSGSRTTETFSSGTRLYAYSSAGFQAQLAEGEITFGRTVVLGSPEIPLSVKVTLKEEGTEIRRVTGSVYTDPDHPIKEKLTRTLGESDWSDAPLTLAKTVESGVIYARQSNGTEMKTTLNNLVYLGRRSDGSFSCVPTSGEVTDEITFAGKGTVTIRRQASPDGSVVSTTCSAGLTVEECSVLIDRGVRQALAPYCLY